MSVNCIRCGKNKRTGADMYCDECRGKRSSQCAFCGKVELYDTREEFAALASEHVLTCEKHPLHVYVQNQVLCLAALKSCVSALDGLLGDTDLPDDDRPGVEAMRNAVAVINIIDCPKGASR